MEALMDLLAILKGDTALTTLLNKNVDNDKINPSPSYTDGIAYNYVPLLNDGIKGQSRFEVTIINGDLLKCYEIKARVDSLLITIGDRQLTNHILSSSANGGGMMNDTELKMFKLKTNYIINERK